MLIGPLMYDCGQFVNALVPPELDRCTGSVASHMCQTTQVLHVRVVGHYGPLQCASYSDVQVVFGGCAVATVRVVNDIANGR